MDEDRVIAKQKLRQQRWQERQERSRASRVELDALRTRVQSLRASLEAKSLEAESVDPEAPTRFADLPLSQRTQLGLERGNYRRMTPVQCDALPLAIAGFDVLGAARTGSGKTLCFVVPLLERLYAERWEAEMGVGALVLSPTRELALQIFKVLQLVGYRHVFSAALLTGGRDVAEERRRLHAISIIVGTPGRVLHHLDEAASVSLDNLQLFALDEADRLLDMGFREALLGILRHLPSERQTLLFSATQTTDVQMLAQLALREPRYVSAHAITAAPTPATLCQNFVVLELHRKLDALLLFLKRHPNDKIVVFVSTCNQVRFMYLAFSKILKKMRIPSMCLTSKMKQFRREEVFLTFCRCRAAVLFCTDVAARGLDFPLVHWVVQYDCPDSAQTYIHRAGRTARAGARGVSLLFLTPREVPMLSFLAHKRVPLREIEFRAGVLQESREIFVALVVQGLKYEAQKAFIAYLRSVYFASNKLVFDVAAIDVAQFAHSLGLLKVPDMSELRNIQRGAKNLPWDVVNYMAEQDREQKQQLTRREKHLAASDMFRMLQQKQRYATLDGDDDEDHVRSKKNLNSNSKNNKEDEDEEEKKKNKKKAAEEDEDDDSDAFLVKKPRDLTSDPREGMQMTVEERMAGLSKRKVRKYIETADLRVRDLGLSKRTVFADEDEDEEEEEDEDGESKKKGAARKGKDDNGVKRGEDSDEEFVTRCISGAGDATADSSDADDVDYAARLRRRVMEEREGDTDRAKRLRRLRRLQREGKVTKRTALDEGGVTLSVGGKRRAEDDDDDSDDGNEYDDSTDVSSQGSLGRLISAAKGELYSDDDEGSEEEKHEDSDNKKKMNKKKKAPQRKRPRVP